MIAMIKTLIEQGHAYAADNGDVYFAVRSDSNYGQVSGRNIDDLMVGARIEENEDKNDPLDFALWKAAKPGEPSWPSPWGEGRPGWQHRVRRHGASLPGHPDRHPRRRLRPCLPASRNECAQATCAWHQGFSNTWMHTGMLLVDGEKMSKSLGNFFTLAEVLEQHSAAALRLLMLQTSYRSPLDFSWERLEGAENSLTRIAGTVENLRWAANHATADADEAASEAFAAKAAETRATFKECMDDDFNTAGAMGAVFGFVTECNQYLEQAVTLPTRPPRLPPPIRWSSCSIRLALSSPSQGRVAAGPAGRSRRPGCLHGRRRGRGRCQDSRGPRRGPRCQELGSGHAIRDQLKDLGLTIEDTAAGTRIKSLNPRGVSQAPPPEPRHLAFQSSGMTSRSMPSSFKAICRVPRAVVSFVRLIIVLRRPFYGRQSQACIAWRQAGRFWFASDSSQRPRCRSQGQRERSQAQAARSQRDRNRDNIQVPKGEFIEGRRAAAEALRTGFPIKWRYRRGRGARCRLVASGR